MDGGYKNAFVGTDKCFCGLSAGILLSVSNTLIQHNRVEWKTAVLQLCFAAYCLLLIRGEGEYISPFKPVFDVCHLVCSRSFIMCTPGRYSTTNDVGPLPCHRI